MTNFMIWLVLVSTLYGSIWGDTIQLFMEWKAEFQNVSIKVAIRVLIKMRKKFGKAACRLDE